MSRKRTLQAQQENRLSPEEVAKTPHERALHFGMAFWNPVHLRKKNKKHPHSQKRKINKALKMGGRASAGGKR